MSVEKISGAVQDKFQFNIVNNRTSAVRVALIGAYYPRFVDVAAAFQGMTEKVEVVTAVDFVGKAVTKEEINVVNVSDLAKALNAIAISQYNDAGYPVDVVLNDASVPDRDDKMVVMSAQNSTKKINDLLSYIKTNPVVLKEMTIVSSDKTAFQADMEVVKINPFKRAPEEVIDLNKFFSKYQQVEDRIDIVLDQPLELCDDLLWIITVPAGATMNFTWRF